GGFARVHEVTDLTTSKTYAGKIIPKCRITKPHHKEKIAREIEVHRHLRHRHVVRFHHYFEDDANVYIILENCARRVSVPHGEEPLEWKAGSLPNEGDTQPRETLSVMRALAPLLGFAFGV
ncbi:Serine/threonine-protein kinase PLK2, partial [Penaeus vannamei]